MTVAPVEDGVALDEGGGFVLTPTVVGPVSPWPRLAEVRRLRTATMDGPTENESGQDVTVLDEGQEHVEDEDIPDTEAVDERRPESACASESVPQAQPQPELAQSAVDAASESVSTRPEPGRFGRWLSEKWNAAVGNMGDAAFVTGLLGSGLGQLSYWTTKFPFWLALSFALTFELAMVGISRRVRIRRINELPAGALHFIGWLAALGAAGWNFIHLSDPGVVVRFELINGGAPLFHGGSVVGASFGTLALLGFLIHEQSEKYHVEDALARKGKKIQRIGAARLLNYPRVSLEVWRSRVADPSLDIDAEFLRVLSEKRGNQILAQFSEPEQPAPAARQGGAAKSSPKSTTSKSTTSTVVRSRSEAELDKLVDAVLAADAKNGQRLGFRKLIERFGLTQADARKLRAKADTAAKKQTA